MTKIRSIIIIIIIIIIVVVVVVIIITRMNIRDEHGLSHTAHTLYIEYVNLGLSTCFLSYVCMYTGL